MVLSWSEKEVAVIDLYKQRKKIRVIAHQLHISSRDVCYIKKKYEEGQNKNGPHKDQKRDPNTGPIYKDIDWQYDIHEERDNLIEENQALKHKKIELDYKLKHKYIETRSGIIAVQTKSLYDDAYRLLDQDVEYCYLIYRNNQFERLIDAARYEADRCGGMNKKEKKNLNKKIRSPPRRIYFLNDK
jgi:hypothetical protein